MSTRQLCEALQLMLSARATRIALCELTGSAYDSAFDGWTALDAEAVIAARTALALSCEYGGDWEKQARTIQKTIEENP